MRGEKNEKKKHEITKEESEGSVNKERKVTGVDPKIIGFDYVVM